MDTLSSGSIGCPVDLGTGELGSGYTMISSSPLAKHPDTGAPFNAFQLPHWEATLDLATRAHRIFAGLAFVGWDIALTDDGPVIVEGNSFPNVESMQQAHGPLLEDTAFKALCMEFANLHTNRTTTK